jgi:hypothetical protein
MAELAFNGMVFCIYHGRGNNHIKASRKWFHYSEYDSVPVRMLCAVSKAQATGIFVDLTPVISLILVPMFNAAERQHPRNSKPFVCSL